MAPLKVKVLFFPSWKEDGSHLLTNTPTYH